MRARAPHFTPDRASAVQSHLDQLAGPAAGLPSGDRRADRGNPDPFGPAGPSGAGPGSYPLGVKVSDRELAAVLLRRHDWHGEYQARGQIAATYLETTAKPIPPATMPAATTLWIKRKGIDKWVEVSR
jgi:hypothetical protein